MGDSFEFRCESCGGTDWGMEVKLTTYACAECQKIRDLETARGVYGKPNPQKVFPHCPRGKRHRLTPWIAGDACPRCGGEMPKTGLVCIWD